MATTEAVGAIGRDTELAAIAGFLHGLSDGVSLLVLEGEPGIGKTTLWSAGVATARAHSFTVLASRPTQSESDLPYLGLGDLLAAVSDDVLGGLPAPQRRSLEIALLRTDAGAAPLQPRAVAVAVLNLLTHMGLSAPLVVAVDDLQWLDVPSRRVLRFALRRLGSAQVGFLFAMRSGTSDMDVAGDAMADGRRVRRLHVGPLAQSAVEHLLRSRVGLPVPSSTIKRLSEASGGNPLFAVELGRALIESPEGEVPGRPLAVPPSLTDLVGSRLARLPQASRACLLIVAALSRPTVDLVRAASAASPDPIASLTAAVDAGVVQIRGGLVEFTHPLLANVIYSQAGAAELRRVHRRLAAEVLDPEERARHLGLSAVAPDAAVAAAIAEGAARAGRRGAPDIAGALFEQAARLTPPESPALIHARLVDSADEYVAVSDMPRAVMLLDEVIANADRGSARARALHRLARLRGLDGAFDAALPVLDEAILEVGDDVALRVALERDLSFAHMQLGDPLGAVPHARAAYEAATATGREVLVADALDQRCMAEFASGMPVSDELLDQAIAVARRVGAAPLIDHPGWGAGRVALGMTLKWAGRIDAARDLLRWVLAEYTDRADEGSLSPIMFHLGELELWAGNSEAALEHCRASRELGLRTGQLIAATRGLLVEAMVDEFRGDADAARSKGRECVAAAEQVSDKPGLIRALKLLGRIELALRRPLEAVEHLDRGVEVESAIRYDPAACRIVPDAIEAFIEAGRMPAAEVLVARLEASANVAGRAWGAASALWGRGLLAAAGGDLDEARSGLERAASAYERLGLPLEQGRSLLALGIVERRLKQKRGARDTLVRAQAIFDGLGARAWSDYARTEQGRIGGRAASPLELTSTESRVAQLVAEGLTNREVAASMFLSEKTIETNLTRIYEKLAVDSRRELARKLRGA